MLQISSYNEEMLEEMGIHESWCLSHDEGLCTVLISNHQPIT